MTGIVETRAPAFTPGPWGIFEKDERVVVAVGQIGEDDICEPLGDTSIQAAANGYLIAVAPELYEALENDILFFDSVANDERWEATGIGNLCRGYASRRRDLLAKARGEQ